jgi:hypothetical protein
MFLRSANEEFSRLAMLRDLLQLEESRMSRDTHYSPWLRWMFETPAVLTVLLPLICSIVFGLYRWYRTGRPV